MRNAFFTHFCVLLAGLLGACSLFEGGTPSYDPVLPHEARLRFAAPSLANVRPNHLKAVRREAGYRVERSSWQAVGGRQAELMLIEALNAKGLEVPDDPQHELLNFTALAQEHAQFGELYQSETAMGPAVWRRFVTGDRKCVVFSQRWDDGPSTPVIRTLFGYYCAAAGQTFTLHDAQRVLSTISIAQR